MSLICCPVRNERSEDVIGESNGNSHDTLLIRLKTCGVGSQTLGFILQSFMSGTLNIQNAVGFS